MLSSSVRTSTRPMDAGRRAEGLRARCRRPSALKPKATPRERAYIDALADRYTGKAEDRAEGRSRLRRRHAQAGRSVSGGPRRQDDLRGIAHGPAAVELLDARRPAVRRDDARFRRSLEQVLASNPKHPGALHYWIHLWEPTDTPERAEAEADRLLPLMPGAGHIVHMPAHIYMRVGRHADVVTVEPDGGEGRRGLHRAVPGAGHVSAWLLPAQHPLHLDGRDGQRAGQGRDRRARTSGRAPSRRRRSARCRSSRDSSSCRTGRWSASARWDDILNDKGPRHDTPFTRGVWRYARAMALIGHRPAFRGRAGARRV